MKRWKHIVPVIGITAATLLTSFALYGEMVDREEQRCWEELTTAAQTVQSEITTKFKDEIVKLHQIEAMMLIDDYLDVESIEKLHIDVVQPTTIFSRIDVLYPDNVLVSNGKEYSIETEIDFLELVDREEYITKRKTDPKTGKECVYYVLPVIKEEQLGAILIGMIESETLKDMFQPRIYNGLANICIIDSEDGNYIMDSWHDTLENVYEQENRKRAKGYEDIDLKYETKTLQTGTIAFESRTTGKNLYMYYMPLEMYQWQLAIFVQEDVVFKHLISYRELFVFTECIEVLLLLMYFAWNVDMVRKLEKSNAEIVQRKEELKWISYRDALTSMYNRTKYTEVLDQLQNQTLTDIGIIYMDLNGLKQINDSQMHEAGDRYICSAANVILDLFKEAGYRIGGDEFVVLAEQMEENIFWEKVSVLKENMEQEHVSISTGAAWQSKCENIHVLIKKAEEKMYQEKEKYYQLHKKVR